MRVIGAAAAILSTALLPVFAHASPLLIGTDVSSDQFILIDPATAAVTPIGPLGDDLVASLTYDSIHGILYGSSTSTNRLLQIDPATGATSTIGPFGVFLMHGIEYNPTNNTLYGVSTGTDLLYQIDVTTGAATGIGPTGMTRPSGLTYDAVHNIMYASDVHVFPEDGPDALYTIDLSTGAGTLVGLFGNAVSITGLAFDPQLGLFGSDNKGTSMVDDQLFKIDPLTGEATLIGNLNSGNTLGLTFIPEPSSLALMLLGAAMSCGLARRMARQVNP